MTWNDLIGIYTAGSITYRFESVNKCTIRVYAKLSESDYSGISIINLLGDRTLSIVGSGSVFSLQDGASVLISDISMPKSTWVDIVIVIRDYSISLYLDGTLISEATMSQLLNFDGVTLYGVGGTMFDELIRVGHAVNADKVAYWARQTEEPVAADAGEPAYQTEIYSHQGTTFRMGQSFSTVLEVRVHQGGEDITEEFSDADFRWRRTSNDEYADSVWNSAHYSTGGKTIIITQDDAVGRCAFFCDLLRKRS